jgi:hypothetical protein
MFKEEPFTLEISESLGYRRLEDQRYIHPDVYERYSNHGESHSVAHLWAVNKIAKHY